MKPRRCLVVATLLPPLAAAALACRASAPIPTPGDPPPSSDVAIGRAQDPQQMLGELSERVLAGYFAHAPVAATVLGEHRHDDSWPDLSPEGRRAWSQWLAEQLDEVAAVPREALDARGRVELDLIRNQLELLAFEARVEQPWTRDPLAYSTLMSTGLHELVTRDFAPLAERVASLTQRLQGMAALVEQARANLSDPSVIKRPHAEVALDQLEGLRELIVTELPRRIEGASAEQIERYLGVAPSALAAVDLLHSHIEALAPRAEGEWRLGEREFKARLRLTLQSELSADTLLALARSEHERVRQEMVRVARELYGAMHSPRELASFEARADGPDAVVRAVLDELAADHPRPGQLRAAAEANLARLDAFVREQGLVPIDTSEVLEVIWTPPHARGVAIAGLAAPAPLDAAKPGLPSFYLVQPIPDDWSLQLRESFLREYNNFMLEILSIHEAIPGHFVQLYWGKREPSPVRRVFANGAFVEGWAVYSEHLMIEAGYAGAGPEPDAKRPLRVSPALWTVMTTPKLRAQAIALHGLKFYLRTVTNAILDHEIHAGTMTRDEAIALMVERSYQERGEAEGKWVRAQLSATQLSTYFVGATAWFRLREQAEARAAAAGEPFDLLAFHTAALSHGAPPVHRLPELMGWE